MTPSSATLFLRLVARHLLAWTLLCAVGAAGSYADQAALAEPRSYGAILQSWLALHVPVMGLSIAVSAALTHRPRWLGRADVLLTGYAAVVVLFMPLSLLYMAGLDVMAAQATLTLSACWARVLAMPRFDWFLELAWASGTGAVVVGLHAWQQSRQREEALQRSSVEVLELQLALEHQRLEALRGQLEPHFLFNALNAIGALIRTADAAQALAGIQQLSELLRYALTAGARDWVSLHEELKFVERYLALQPLIDNALRHDLDRHDGPSEIELRCVREGERLTIEVSNPALRDAAPNPGTGLGLRHTEGRLRLLYGDAASMQIDAGAHRFCVRLRLPSRAPESAVPA
ncbi:MAG: sensor histidine kinase [Rubrivivax sp.]|nr:MAG: sensor histidine kinase [Rubrivivax sp.]